MICPRPHGLYHFAPVGERGSRLAGSPWTIYGPWHQSSGPGAQRSALPGSSLARSSTQSSSRTLRVLGSSVPRGGAVALILAYRVERTLAHLHCGCAELTGVRVPVFVFPVFTAHGPQALLNSGLGPALVAELPGEPPSLTSFHFKPPTQIFQALCRASTLSGL